MAGGKDFMKIVNSNFLRNGIKVVCAMNGMANTIDT